MLLGAAAVFGLVISFKRKSRLGWVLAGLFFSNAIPLFLAMFISRNVDERFGLLLTLPTAVLFASVLPSRRRLITVILVLLLIATPFKLYETFNATPTYVYDGGASVHFEYGEFSKFRTYDAFQLAAWNAKVNVNNVLTENYEGQLLQQFYDPALIYYIGAHDPNRVSYHPTSDILILYHRYYTTGRFGEAVLADLNQLTSKGQLIYNDGTQFGYFVGP